MNLADRGLIAYCGVDCAACTDCAAKTCPGCRATEWVEGDECLPVKCRRARGIAVCGECADFPCADMRKFCKESPGHEAAYKRMTEKREN